MLTIIPAEPPGLMWNYQPLLSGLPIQSVPVEVQCGVTHGDSVLLQHALCQYSKSTSEDRGASCRKLLLGSLVGVVAALLLLGAAFRLAEISSPTFITDPTQKSCPLPQARALTCTNCVQQV